MSAIALALLAAGCAMMRNGSKESLDAVVYMVAFWLCVSVTLVLALS